MRILHAGLSAASEKNADVFFQDCLGLIKSAPVNLPADFCGGVFGIAREMIVINYKGDHVHFEVFINPSLKPDPAVLSHACLEIRDTEGFLAKCVSKGMRVSRTPKGDSVVIFVSDLDGNRYEIKKTKPAYSYEEGP